MRGLFITFEGIEGCGKSTQAEMLAEYLQQEGKEVFLTREPGGPLISEKIRHILLSKSNSAMLPETELLLYSASRSQHTGEWILPLLETGNIVISDRYYDSTRAYQGVARQIDSDMIEILCRFAAFDLEPDITFLIDLPAQQGLSRIKAEDADRLESEAMDFHERVRQGFLELAAKEKRIIIIDGQNTIEEINRNIIAEYKKKLESEAKNET
ncbi:MAG: dTMP kinase [Candidatus Cloacimonetes bacterium]|nr:dTMP kinase [Candidatus Cloacimonadota bacterium]